MDIEDAQTVALQEYFESSTPAGYGASFRAGWAAGQDYEARHCPQEGRIVVLKAEVERLRAALEDVATSSDGEQGCWCPESKPLTADHMPACRRARQALGA